MICIHDNLHINVFIIMSIFDLSPSLSPSSLSSSLLNIFKNINWFCCNGQLFIIRYWCAYVEYTIHYDMSIVMIITIIVNIVNPQHDHDVHRVFTSATSWRSILVIQLVAPLADDWFTIEWRCCSSITLTPRLKCGGQMKVFPATQ